MKRHKPNVIYMTRFAAPHGFVKTHDEKSIDIGYGVDGKTVYWLQGVSRQQARMLAKRINQLLDATK